MYVEAQKFKTKLGHLTVHNTMDYEMETKTIMKELHVNGRALLQLK
jgi:hypothetical protein